MEYNGRIKKCFYALLACIFNPELSVSKSQDIFELKESDGTEETIEEKQARRAHRQRKYYEKNREQVLAQNKANRERNRGK